MKPRPAAAIASLWRAGRLMRPTARASSAPATEALRQVKTSRRRRRIQALDPTAGSTVNQVAGLASPTLPKQRRHPCTRAGHPRPFARPVRRGRDHPPSRNPEVQRRSASISGRDEATLREIAQVGERAGARSASGLLKRGPAEARLQQLPAPEQCGPRSPRIERGAHDCRQIGGPLEH
jgi:hypothetical protein